MSIFTACNHKDATPSVPENLPAQHFNNVSYGKDTLQRMDVYLPASRSVQYTKAFVLIHGGGWNGGSKTEFNTYIDTFKKRMPDYAIFNLDYRLVNGGNLFPTQEQDIKAALDFITDKAGDYHISKDNFVLLGFSAGGHLALLQAYKYKQPAVKAVIDFFGPTDLMAMYHQPWHPLVPYALQMVTGTDPQSNPSIYQSSSPVNFVTPQSPPTIIFHGALDNIVDVSQSRLLKQKLEKAGVPHELIVYPNERHGWFGAKLSQSFNKVEVFLKNNVR